MSDTPPPGYSEDEPLLVPDSEDQAATAAAPSPPSAPNHPKPQPNQPVYPSPQPFPAPQPLPIAQPVPQNAVQPLVAPQNAVQPLVAAVQPPGPIIQHPYMAHPYQPGPMMVVPLRPPLLPRERQPNDYLVITLVVAIACGLFNLTSLFFSVPAVICSAIAFERRNYAKYSEARQFGMAAIVLNLICVAWVMAWGVIATALIGACAYEAGICEYHYYYYD